MMHGYGMMGQMNMMGPLMWIPMLLLWGFAIFGLVCLVRWIIARTRRQDEERPGPA